MNQKLKKVLSLSLAGVLAVPFLSVFASCGKDGKKKGDRNENDVLVFSSGEFDGVFNPFFSTSAYDSSIVGQTMISMLGSDDYGKNVTYGVNEPVVALDFNETMYEDKQGTVETDEGNEDGSTIYQIVLKNNIKFSDGQPLTAHDVLFNMYVYLDPNYTGSSTMYSTKIQGLAAYQYQDPSITDGAAALMEETFAACASQRIDAIVAYVTEQKNWQSLADTYVSLCKNAGVTLTYGETEILADIEKIKTEWKKELETDWNAYASDVASYEKEYTFTKGWQVYFYEEGLISRKKDPAFPQATVYLKDKNGKYVIDWEAAGIKEDAKYTKEQAIETVYNAWLNDDEYIATILGAWMTGATMSTSFANNVKELYFESTRVDGQMRVANIAGIRIRDAVHFNGETKYEEGEYEMLEVQIDGVDPKAKWNLSFTVAPMHYYSTPELSDAALADDDYSNNFGVKHGSDTFMETLKRRNAVPMGAGMYRAATDDDTVYEWSDNAAKEDKSFQVLKDGFKKNNIVHFVRNEYFKTTSGEKDGNKEIYNAKIKHVRYKVVNSNQTMTALEGGAIHFADPSATTQNIGRVEAKKFLEHKEIMTAGYGYIGINAKAVPNIYIRRALMSVMDISLVQDYYPGNLSQPLYRGFSKTSWVYDENKSAGLEKWEPSAYYPFTEDDESTPLVDESFELAKSYLEQGGCKSVGSGANLHWEDENGDTIEFKFIVAGDTTDHPAYSTFLKAVKILKKNGIHAEVNNDARALSKLASGALDIWAAAWSSTVDPDMYQVYHKDSKATSVENWGYSFMRQNKDDISKEDWDIIEELSVLIEEGRKILDNALRAPIYREAADLVMDLAVELPTYQRSDMNVYNNTVLDASTFNQNPTPYAGLLNKQWQVSFLLK